MKHIYDKDFKYTRQSEMGDDYLQRKFKKLAAEMRKQAEAAKQSKQSSVLKLRRQS